ncbi:MAG: DUF308 domain-containing protein [Bacteroidales bacterium]|nr:DUF308 domain-containing protein [Bacteroidales bacterium]
MKGKTLSTLGILIAAVGAVLIICHKQITSTGIVITGGILFMAVGLVNLIIYGQSTKGDHGMGRAFAQIANAAAIVLGICMLVFESTFSPLVPFIFGLLVAVCALWEFFLLAVGTRPHSLPGWMFVFPLLLAGGSVFIFLQKDAEEHLIMLVTGIALAVLGVGCIIEGSALGMVRRAARKAEAAPAQTPAHDAQLPSSTQSPKHPSETTDNLDDPSEMPSDEENSAK